MELQGRIKFKTSMTFAFGQFVPPPTWETQPAWFGANLMPHLGPQAYQAVLHPLWDFQVPALEGDKILLIPSRSHSS